jgi:hypothetical protein
MGATKHAGNVQTFLCTIQFLVFLKVWFFDHGSDGSLPHLIVALFSIQQLNVWMCTASGWGKEKVG